MPVSIRVIASTFACAVIALVFSPGARAAQPVLRLFTTEDGLVRNWVRQIRRDRMGRLWFCTTEGLSLFDGEKFTNYTAADGLPSGSIYDFLDAGGGEYWIITSAGLFRFHTRSGPVRSPGVSFVNVPLERAQYPIRYSAAFKASLLQTRSGEIWAAGPGLYRIEHRNGTARGALVQEWDRSPNPNRSGRWIGGLTEDRHGNLWISAGSQMIRRAPDGQFASWGSGNGIYPDARVLMEDRQGRLWLGGAAWSGGLQVLDISHGAPSVLARFTTPLPASDVQALFEDASGDIWVGGRGLARLRWNGPGDARWTTYPQKELLGSQDIASIAGDAQDNLWVAVGSMGVARMLRSGFSKFSLADGLASQEILSVFESGNGELYAVTVGHELNRLEGERFATIHPRLPPSIRDFGWGIGSIVLEDRRGEWWMGTGQGLVRFPPLKSGLELSRTKSLAVYGPDDGLPGKVVLKLLEDHQGGIWVSLHGGLARWDPATQSFQNFTSGMRALASSHNPTPLALAEDGAGQMWIGLDDGGLLRYRTGRFEVVGGGRPVYVNAFLADRRKRLWIASARDGLGRIDHPGDASPALRWYTTTDGLSSNQLFAVAEDHAGRIYASGGHGVDRADPDSGLVQHYVTSDGLPPGDIGQLYCDRSGAMWFGSDFGLARHQPEFDRASGPPPPLIHHVQVAGVAALLSDDGETAVAGLELPPGKDDIEIAYGSVDFSVSHGPRYQYRLSPVDREWRKPTAARSVQYARLGAGRYTFQVRGISSGGMVSDRIASVAFQIPPPVWQRWWFLLSSAGALFALGYLAYAYRLRHALAVQRIRTRLASDLHDDLGSGLAEIAILAEVARQQAPSQDSEVMATVAERARELRAAMGDIVWSVDPACDNLTGVIRRWRQVAAGLLGNVSLGFTAPPETITGAIEILPDRRRHLLLLFKEAITNVARHAAAAHVDIVVSLKATRLHLRIADDGRGFRPDETDRGNGLRTLAHRTEELGGELRIRSAPGEGSTVELDIPAAGSKPHVHAVARGAPPAVD